MMNITKQEQGALVSQKVIEGKTYEQAYEDVNKDINFLKNFNRIKKEKIKIIRKKEKDIENLDKTFKKEFKKLKEPERKLPQKTKGNFATTYHLSRILTYLKEIDDFVTNKELCQACLTSPDYIKNGLIFLQRFNMVEKKRNRKGFEVFGRKYK